MGRGDAEAVKHKLGALDSRPMRSLAPCNRHPTVIFWQDMHGTLYSGHFLSSSFRIRICGGFFSALSWVRGTLRQEAHIIPGAPKHPMHDGPLESLVLSMSFPFHAKPPAKNSWRMLKRPLDPTNTGPKDPRTKPMSCTRGFHVHPAPDHLRTHPAFGTSL